MDFFIIANAWSAGKDNPTSKHRIALELVRQGHRVLWIEGSGMRTPSVGSSSDRLRMVRKVVASLRGARREESVQCPVFSVQKSNAPQIKTADPNPLNTEHLTLNTAFSPAALWVLSPLFIPLPRYELVRRLNGLICRWAIRYWGWRLGFHDPVLINYVPVLAEAMRGGRRASPQLSVTGYSLLGNSTNNKEPITNNPPRAPRVVYHCVDRWDAFAMYDSAMMGDMDRRCCRYADLVIASAGELYDRCKAINPNTVLIPHGVDWEHFRRGAIRTFNIEHSTFNVEQKVSQAIAPPPLDVECSMLNVECSPSSRPIIGFFGLLSEWVDQDLLLRLAREFPYATVQLIGKADVDVSRLKGMSNIQLTGPEPFAELPDLIAQFTVGIIPFVVNDLTRSVNPIKLREMLSAGCPVVSTALPEVARYAGDQTLDPRHQTIDLNAESARLKSNVYGLGSKVSSVYSVQVARNHDEFVAMVGRFLVRPLSPEERLALSDSMAGETWSAKVKTLLALIS